MYTLCVIDMQQYFGVVPKTTVTDNVAREIRQAITDDAAIIFVEYKTCGDTLTELTDIAYHAGSTKVFKVAKKNDDGSEEIVETVRKNGLPDDYIKVVGVNTDCCVLSTVAGLSRKLLTTKIEVVADACNSTWSPVSHQRGLKDLRALGCRISNDQPVESA